MKISDQGVAFIAAHEGFVSRSYSDAVGVRTIGYGFTNRSAIFSAYWKTKTGHLLQAGDTISRADADVVLRKLLDEEYGVSIDAKCKPTAQNQFDACASVSYNAGPGSLGDAWGRALAADDVKGAASLLRTYKLTHGLLIKRRADEARLLESGVYGPGVAVVGTAAAPSVSSTADSIKDYQAQLAALGKYTGPIDGLEPSIHAAVVAYQAAHPDLVTDGIVGPATRASLANDVAASKAAPAPQAPVSTATTAAGGAAAVVVVGASVGLPWWAWTALGVVAIAVVAFFLLRKKG